MAAVSDSSLLAAAGPAMPIETTLSFKMLRMPECPLLAQSGHHLRSGEYPTTILCYKQFMQKPLTPRQKLEYENLEHARRSATSAMHEAELASGRSSPQFAVAERQRDEIEAKMQRMAGVPDGAQSGSKAVSSRIVTMVVRSKRFKPAK